MIYERAIREWNEVVPWKSPQMVEQDLVICRALVSIFSDDFLRENLAFRGGTALHKLYLSPQPRYSEDIDLVQINPGPIKPIMFRLGEVLDWLPNRNQNENASKRRRREFSVLVTISANDHLKSEGDEIIENEAKRLRRRSGNSGGKIAEQNPEAKIIHRKM